MITRFNRFSKWVLALFAFACAMAVIPKSGFAAEITLRMHHFLPAQASVPSHVLKVWADRIESQSGGRIKIKRFPSMQLGGKPPELIDQVIDGVADIVWTVAGYTPGRFPRAEVFELPFTMTNAQATSHAYWQLAKETMMDKDFKQFKVLGLWVHGPGLIHSKRPIKTLEDLNGVKLRAPSRITTKLFQSLGATPIGMPVPAVPAALTTGVLDAAVIPWEVTLPLKVNEMVNYHTGFGDKSLYTLAFILAMNKERWNALPTDLQAIIEANSGAEFSAFAGRQMQEDDAPGLNQAKTLGNTIITLPKDEIRRWQVAAQPVIDQWVEEMDAKKLDGTGLRKRALELIDQYTVK